MKEITAEQILKKIEEKNSKEGVFSDGKSKRKNDGVNSEAKGLGNGCKRNN